MKVTLLVFVFLLKGNLGHPDPIINSLLNRIEGLETRVQTLERQNSELKAEKNDEKGDVDERLNHLEEVSKMKIARTCDELSRYGITTSGEYTLDPDAELNRS